MTELVIILAVVLLGGAAIGAAILISAAAIAPDDDFETHGRKRLGIDFEDWGPPSFEDYEPRRSSALYLNDLVRVPGGRTGRITRFVGGGELVVVTIGHGREAQSSRFRIDQVARP